MELHINQVILFRKKDITIDRDDELMTIAQDAKLDTK